MKRFAQLLYGKVIELREAEDLGQLSLVFGPENYWVDVTDVDCEIGYITRYVPGAGVIFVDPVEDAKEREPNSLEEAIEIKKIQLGDRFAKERDKIRFITLDENRTYGFDCASEDITNFLAAFLPLAITQQGTISYKVWLNETDKGIVELSYEDMTNVYNYVRTDQLRAYATYETKKAMLMQATTIEEAMSITWDDTPTTENNENE